jgi:Ca2+:H+ antiporter
MTAALALVTAGPFVLSLAFRLLLDRPDAEGRFESLRAISITASVIFLILYLLWTFFRYKTHAYLYEDYEDDDEYGTGAAGTQAGITEETQPILQRIFYLVLLALAIAASILCSILLVQCLPNTANKYSVSPDIITAIVLPCLTSFSNFSKTWNIAYRGNMDLAVILTLGTSVEISLLALPILILVGDAFGRSFLLNFQLFDTSVLLIASFIASLLVFDGKSTYLKGAEAVALWDYLLHIFVQVANAASSYLIIAIAFSQK